MRKGPVLSTGSGGYGYNNFQNNPKGVGGGIVYIFAKKSLILQDSNI